jgi:hypothetical protein
MRPGRRELESPNGLEQMAASPRYSGLPRRNEEPVPRYVIGTPRLLRAVWASWRTPSTSLTPLAQAISVRVP